MHLSRPRRQRTLLPLSPLRFKSCPRRIGLIALVHCRPPSTGDVSAPFRAARCTPYQRLLRPHHIHSVSTPRAAPPGTSQHDGAPQQHQLTGLCAFRAAHSAASYRGFCHFKAELLQATPPIASAATRRRRHRFQMLAATVSARVLAPAQSATAPSACAPTPPLVAPLVAPLASAVSINASPPTRISGGVHAILGFGRPRPHRCHRGRRHRAAFLVALSI